MKQSFLLFAVLLVLTSSAQKIEKYYDDNWKETEPVGARFYGVILKTDSGWHRQDYFVNEKKLQMDGFYEDEDTKVENGLFRYYNSNGNLESIGRYQHGKKEGVWISYYPSLMMRDSGTYINGNPIGVRLAWSNNGILTDSAQFEPNGSGVEISWFNNGNIAAAGYFSVGMKQNGKWKYFHKNGKQSATEVYQDGVLVNKQYFDEAEIPITDTTNKDTPAAFPGGKSAWDNYLSKHIQFPSQYKIENANKATVVVNGVIDEDGNMTDVTVTTPFFPQFDVIALNAVKKSPKWVPAIEHNRRVSYAFRQGITFFHR